jgi:hypothetical protein
VGFDPDLAAKATERAQLLAEDRGHLLVRALEEYVDTAPSLGTKS